jgi:hypothetical protein
MLSTIFGFEIFSVDAVLLYFLPKFNKLAHKFS